MFANFFKTLAVAVAVGAGVSAPAMAADINFDAVTSGLANDGANAAAAGVTFDYAFFGPSQDASGMDITGSDHWIVDTSVAAVDVANRNTSGFGGVYSLSNGLDAVPENVMIHLGGHFDVNSFSIQASSYDGQSFGGFYNPTIEFLRADGLPVGQAVSFSRLSGVFTAATTTQYQDVTDVLLASGALYNNISFSATAVPVPGAVWLFGSALAGMIGLRRRQA